MADHSRVILLRGNEAHFSAKSVIVHQRTSSEVHQRCQYQQIVKCIEDVQYCSPSSNHVVKFQK